MLCRYQEKTITDEELDRMLLETDAAEKAEDRAPRFLVAEVEVADDESVNAAVLHVLDYMADASRDDHQRNMDGHDVLRAANARGMVLGTVFASARRPHKIVELDYDRCTDAIAWAAVTDLPSWVVRRFIRLVASTPPC